MTLSDLITAVERAEGPSREIDHAIDAAYAPEGYEGVAHYTASIDAVVALIRRDMPGWEWAVVEESPTAPKAACEAWVYPPDWKDVGDFRNGAAFHNIGQPALALLLAFLRAARARQENDTP